MQTFLTTIINSRKLTQQLNNSKKIKKRHKVGKKGKLKSKFIFFSLRGLMCTTTRNVVDSKILWSVFPIRTFE